MYITARPDLLFIDFCPVTGGVRSQCVPVWDWPGHRATGLSATVAGSRKWATIMSSFVLNLQQTAMNHPGVQDTAGVCLKIATEHDQWTAHWTWVC